MYSVQFYRQRLLLDMADDAPAVSPRTDDLTAVYLCKIKMPILQNSLLIKHTRYICSRQNRLQPFFPLPFSPPISPWNWLKSPCHFLPKFHNMVLIPSMHNLIHFLLQTINLQAWSPFEAPPSSHPFQGTPFEWKSSHKKSFLTHVADKHFML